MRSRTALAGMMVALLGASPALAHVGAGGTSSLAAGLAHPLAGLDHMTAMVAVGLWAGLVGGRQVWLWPATFVATMLAGAALGLSGFALPFVEPAIAASVVVLGILAAMALKAPWWAGAVPIALFALAHGHAHGTELGGANAGGYMAGFALSTAFLHATGIGIALLGVRYAGALPVRLAGAATAAAGVVMLIAR